MFTSILYLFYIYVYIHIYLKPRILNLSLLFPPTYLLNRVQSTRVVSPFSQIDRKFFGIQRRCSTCSEHDEFSQKAQVSFTICPWPPREVQSRLVEVSVSPLFSFFFFFHSIASSGWRSGMVETRWLEVSSDSVRWREKIRGERKSKVQGERGVRVAN